MNGPPIPVAVGTAVGMTLARKVSEGKWKSGDGFRVLVAGTVAGTALYFMQQVSPDVSAAFSWLLILGAILINGAPVFKRIGKVA